MANRDRVMLNLQVNDGGRRAGIGEDEWCDLLQILFAQVKEMECLGFLTTMMEMKR